MKRLRRYLLAQQTKSHNASSGFTLIEVIVVMVIIGVVTLIALPSFKSFTRSSHASSATNDLVSALNFARSEAITQSANVTVCKSDDFTTPSCNTATVGSPATGEWNIGWMVFVDVDGAGDFDGGTDTVLRVYSSPGGNVTMVGNEKVAKRLTYAKTGFFSEIFNGTITVSSGSKSIKIVASNNGRIITK